MHILFADASYTRQHSDKMLDGKPVMGRICVAQEEGFSRVELVGIGKVAGFLQYPAIFELTAIARAIEVAVEKGWIGDLTVCSDSRTAIGWADNGIKEGKKAYSETHKNAYDYFKRVKGSYIGQITYSFVSRQRSPARRVLEQAIDKENKEKPLEKVKEIVTDPTVALSA